VTKHCGKCGKDKPTGEFARDKKNKDGLRGFCKACARSYRNSVRSHRSQYMSEWRERNKEHIAEYNAANRDRVMDYRERTRERKRAHDRDYHSKNRDKINAQAAEYLRANREAIRLRGRNWHQANRERVNAKNRNRRQANIEKYRAAERDYLRKHAEAREKARVRLKKWTQENREHVREKARAYRAAHASELSEWHKRHYRNNKSAYIEKAREARDIRRARLRGNGVERVSYKRIRQRDKDTCHICGKKVSESEISFDHLIPISDGGPHAEWNLAVSHLKCNLKRGPGWIPAQPHLPLETA